MKSYRQLIQKRFLIITSRILESSIAIKERGFTNWDFLDQLRQNQTLFILHIENHMKTKLDRQRYRMVWFCDLESRTELRLASHVKQITHEEICEFYRHR